MVINVYNIEWENGNLPTETDVDIDSAILTEIYDDFDDNADNAVADLIISELTDNFGVEPIDFDFDINW